MEAEGYRVLTALTGAAAESITEAERPDLIVTDWMMPGVDGIGLCRWLKTDKVTATIPCCHALGRAATWFKGTVVGRLLAETHTDCASH
nr:response regulator [Paraburkholderia sacchari]